MAELDFKNHFLSKISVVARTALAHKKNVDIGQFIGAGPSIRARARLAIASAFLVAAPTLFVGVMRTQDVAHHAARLSQYDDYWKRMLETRITLKELDLAIWAYTSEREFENGQAVIVASEHFKRAIHQMVAERPAELDIGPEGFFEGLALRLDGIIKRAVANNSGLAQGRLTIMSIANELKTVELRVVDIVQLEKRGALGSLSMVGRDQLILFLVLLFAIPIFVGFVPGWLVMPLSRLRQIVSKIELGQIKEMQVSGRDEVALLARSLKTYFTRKEDVDHKKSSKIFEMRNVLRSVLARIEEPVFIVDANTKINYTNEAASQLVNLPPHQMEGKLIGDCMYSPSMKKACERAFTGDVDDRPSPIAIELNDGRMFSRSALIGVVRNRDGDISRAVVVLKDEV